MTHILHSTKNIVIKDTFDLGRLLNPPGYEVELESNYTNHFRRKLDPISPTISLTTMIKRYLRILMKLSG